MISIKLNNDFKYIELLLRIDYNISEDIIVSYISIDSIEYYFKLCEYNRSYCYNSPAYVFIRNYFSYYN